MNSVRPMSDKGHTLSFLKELFPSPEFVDGSPVYTNWKHYVAMPLYACEYCTASFWGSISFWCLCVPFFGLDWLTWPVYCFTLVGLRFEIYSFYLALQGEFDKEDKKEDVPEPLETVANACDPNFKIDLPLPDLDIYDVCVPQPKLKENWEEILDKKSKSNKPLSI